MEKIKNILLGILTSVLAIVYFMFRIKKDRLDKAQSDLNKALFKAEVAKHEEQYQDAKANADRLADEYERSRTDEPR